MANTELLLILACAFGFFMAWGVGANDVANAMGTSVGSKAISLRQAVIIAAIFESAGALLAGGEVTSTIRGQIIDTQTINIPPEHLVYGMMAALLAAGVWLLIASYMAWPVSTTHSIIGAIIGFGTITLGVDSIHWHMVLNIVLSWFITPILSGVIAFFIFRSIQFFILNKPDPLHAAKRYVPVYIFIVTFIITLVTLTKGLKHLGWSLTTGEGLAASCLAGLTTTLIGAVLIYRQHIAAGKRDRFAFKRVEKVFGVLMIFTASAMAFAHGSNDVANAIGPLAAIVSILGNGGSLTQQTPVPPWILLLGAVGIVAGLALYGYRVIATIGQQITELTPSRGFSAELATATTVVLASGTGLPISTTQTLVGAVLGVGFARGISALNLPVIRNIFMSWAITLPAGATLAVLFFYLLKLIL